MKEMLKRTWAQILLALLGGLLLLSVPSEGRLGGLIHEVGTAFIVAAIVTASWHLREVSEVIDKYVRSILIEHDFLIKLKLPALMDLRSKAAKAILEQETTNPNYRRDELEAWIDNLLYERLLPGKAPSSGLYRENYYEEIVVEYLTLERALEFEKASTDGILTAELLSAVMRVTTTTTYTVISPHLLSPKDSGYPVGYTNEGCGVPHIPPEKLARVKVGRNKENAKEVTVKTGPLGDGQILIESASQDVNFEGGECEVWMQVVEYKSPLREPFVLNTMALLTRGLEARIQHVGPGPHQVFIGQLITTPSEKGKQRDAGVHHASLQYKGWLFEDHGYQFYWFEAPQKGEDRTVSNLPTNVGDQLGPCE